MWFWIIVVVVLVCICVAVAQSGEDQANIARAALDQQRLLDHAQQTRAEKDRAERLAARLPEALAQLLREEFPQFKEVFTYGRCQQLLSWHSTRGKEAIQTARTREPARADRLLGMLFAREIAPIFLADFTELASKQPEDVWRTVEICINASALRAQG